MSTIRKVQLLYKGGAAKKPTVCGGTCIVVGVFPLSDVALYDKKNTTFLSYANELRMMCTDRYTSIMAESRLDALVVFELLFGSNPDVGAEPITHTPPGVWSHARAIVGGEGVIAPTPDRAIEASITPDFSPWIVKPQISSMYSGISGSAGEIAAKVQVRGLKRTHGSPLVYVPLGFEIQKSLVLLGDKITCTVEMHDGAVHLEGILYFGPLKPGTMFAVEDDHGLGLSFMLPFGDGEGDKVARSKNTIYNVAVYPPDVESSDSEDEEPPKKRKKPNQPSQDQDTPPDDEPDVEEIPPPEPPSTPGEIGEFD